MGANQQDGRGEGKLDKAKLSVWESVVANGANRDGPKTLMTYPNQHDGESW